MANTSQSFLFGIYPGGASGTAEGSAAEGPPDDPQRITAALEALQGGGRPFVVRAYEPFHDSPAARTSARSTPADPAQYLGAGRRLDLVLLFQSVGGLAEAFLPFVRQTVRRYGPLCSTIQITEEPNVPHAGMDGAFPRVREALVRGVIAAREELARCGLDHVAVGFNAAPSFDPADTFWADIGALGGAEFAAAVGYVGLDFFPGVFRPLAPDGEAGDLRSMVLAVLQTMRGTWLPAAGIPAATPIHITEHGWPTGPDRSPARQAEVIEAVIRTVHSQRQALNIRRYQLFDLRDADSANPNFFFQFGLLRDDYTPKPAFEVFCRLVAELTESAEGETAFESATFPSPFGRSSPKSEADAMDTPSELTQRLVLREVSPDDLPIFFVQGQDAEAIRMAAFTSADPTDRAVFDAHWSRNMADPAVVMRTIVLDGLVAGHIARFEQFGEPELSYWLGREHWGRGVATAALAAFLRLQGERPLYARVAKDNPASRRVLEKCGFAVCGEDKGFAHGRGAEVEEFILRLDGPAD